MTTTDFRSSGQESARSAWWAYKTAQADALDNVSQEELFYAAFSAGARWNFRMTSQMAPYLDSFVRLLEYLSAREDD